MVGVHPEASGEREQGRKIAANIGNPIIMSFYHLIASEIDAALDCSERAIGQRQPAAVLVAAAAHNEPLRAHPRWPKLAKMMNLPQGAPPASDRST